MLIRSSLKPVPSPTTFRKTEVKMDSKFYTDGNWTTDDSSELGDTQDVIKQTESFAPGKKFHANYSEKAVVGERKLNESEKAKHIKSNYDDDNVMISGLLGFMLGGPMAALGAWGLGASPGLTAAAGLAGLLAPAIATARFEKKSALRSAEEKTVPVWSQVNVSGNLSRKGKSIFFTRDGQDKKVKLLKDKHHIKKEHRFTNLSPNFYRGFDGAWSSADGSKSPMGDTNQVIRISEVTSPGSGLLLEFEPNESGSEKVKGIVTRKKSQTYFQPEGQDHKVKLNITPEYRFESGSAGGE